MQVCVSGSVGTGDLNDIAGESFEVDLSLSDGTAQGQGSSSTYWFEVIPLRDSIQIATFSIGTYINVY